MTDEILSFDDYSFFMTKKMRLLRHFERCIFMAWCAEHLLESHVRLVEENLSKSDLLQLRDVLDVIWGVLLEGSIPTTDMLHQLDIQYMEIEADPFEIDPVAFRVKNSIGLSILGCRRNDVGLAVQAGEDVITILELELAEQNIELDEDLPLAHPAIKKELETQLAMVNHLRKAYDLEGSLRSLFRD